MFADGWDTATYSFTGTTLSASSTLADGYNQTDTICLTDDCYELSVTESEYPSEVGHLLNRRLAS